ncbi:MAG: hypothetical protein ACOC4Z_02540 [Patescibacteria group bacterium]
MNYWKIIQGKNPVLLLADYNHPHIKNGKLKQREEGTAEIVKQICQKHSLWGITAKDIITEGKHSYEKIINSYWENNLQALINIRAQEKKTTRPIKFFPNEYFQQDFPYAFEQYTKADKAQNKLSSFTKAHIPTAVVCIERKVRKNFEMENNPAAEYLDDLITKILEN